jgi:hypothetical protein
MRKAPFLILTILLFAAPSYGQKVEFVYLNPADSTLNRYIIVYPSQVRLAGFMFLIPSFGEAPQTVLTQTNLPSLAAQQGILTIIPTFKTGPYSLGIDSATQASFVEMLDHVISRYKLKDKKFFVGGFSIGGSCAVKFAEVANKTNFKIKPAAVFAIDPPLDFERFYNAAKRSIRLSKSIHPNEEAVYMVGRIEQEMNGTPQQSILNYYKLSPYSANDSTQRAVKLLTTTPIMIVAEPDINWWLMERGFDFYNLNVMDGAAMINELRRLGNTKATLVTTQNKGFRQPGNRRHPHSWSIAESNQLIQWLQSQ